jgi:hypothetical protein
MGADDMARRSERTFHQVGMNGQSTAGCDRIGHTSVNAIVALVLVGALSLTNPVECEPSCLSSVNHRAFH